MYLNNLKNIALRKIVIELYKFYHLHYVKQIRFFTSLFMRELILL